MVGLLLPKMQRGHNAIFSAARSRAVWTRRAGKNGGGREEEIFAREPLRFCAAPQSRRYQASGVFDKVGSSEIVNILQDLTFRFLTSHFVGGAQHRPLILGVSVRFARGQAEVRAKDFFGNNLFLQKVVIPCDFDEG